MALSFREHLGIQPSTFSISDSVLLIIDAQNEYDRGLLKVQDFRTSVAAIAELLQRYRAAGGDIIHVLHDTSAEAPLFTTGTGLEEAFESVAPKDGEGVVHKLFPISFTGTDLEERIKKTGKKKLVVTGYMAHVCVSGVVRVGFEKGYDIAVARDCVGDRDIPGKKAAEVVETVLAELADVFATIVESKEIQG